MDGIYRKIEHPSGMSVELIDAMSDDLGIVNAARVSLGKESQWLYREDGSHYLSPADDGLLGYLMRERHGTPFEMVQLKFRVKAPIGVVWEWVRHRIASYNVMSTRYVEWEKDYYTPEPSEWRTQVGKVGHYKFASIDDPDYLIENMYVEAMEDAFSYYGLLLEQGLAKEVARNVLPMGAMTEFIWSINVRSLLNFLSLRNEEHALKEMQICAAMVEDLTKLIVPITLEKWNAQERRAP